MKLITHTGSHAEGRWIMGGHYSRAGLEETAAHGGQRLGGQQPMEIKMKVDGVSAESGERRMTSTHQNLRIRSLIYCKCDRTVWNLDLLLLHFFVAQDKWMKAWQNRLRRRRI